MKPGWCTTVILFSAMSSIYAVTEESEYFVRHFNDEYELGTSYTVYFDEEVDSDGDQWSEEKDVVTVIPVTKNVSWVVFESYASYIGGGHHHKSLFLYSYPKGTFFSVYNPTKKSVVGPIAYSHMNHNLPKEFEIAIEVEKSTITAKDLGVEDREFKIVREGLGYFLGN